MLLKLHAQGLLPIRTREVKILFWRKDWGGSARIPRAVLNFPAPEGCWQIGQISENHNKKWLRAGAIDLGEKIKRTNYVLLVQTRQAVEWGGDKKTMYDYLRSVNTKVGVELLRWVQGGDNFEVRGRK